MDPLSAYGVDLLWILSTGFGKLVFVMIFLTWGLVIVNLFLGMLLMVRKLFGKKNK